MQCFVGENSVQAFGGGGVLTYPGKTHDKRIADEEHLTYSPGTILYKDTAFQGYEPPVQKTCQAKKTRVANLN